MKWFKHLCNAHKGSALQELYAEFGINEGHGLYFRLVEFLADKWDGVGEPRFKFLTEVIRSHLAISPKKFQKFAGILAESSETEVNFSGKFFEIFFPKLLEIRHRDALNASIRLELSPKKNGGEEKRSTSCREISPAKRQEARFRFAKEISEIEGLLATLFDGLAPKAILNLVPDMIIVCDGDPVSVRTILDDLYQSPKIRTGEGLEGSKSAYITAAIQKRFFDNGAA